MNRKVLSLLAAATLLVFVAGCGKNADDTKGANTASNSSSSSSTSSSSSAPSSSASSSSSSTASNSNSSTSAASTPKKEEPKPVEKVKVGPLKVGETAKVGPLSVTLKQTAVVDKAAGIPAGYIYLLAEVQVANDGSDAYTINITDHFKLDTPEGKKAPYNVQATANREPRLQGTIEQGKNSSGWIGYLSKKVAGTYKYQFIHPDYGEATWEFSLK
jgi:cytoskeletal protein RodZ